jgi:carboxypeptidase D
MIQNMDWNGETGLGTVQTQSWSVNGSAAGTWVASRNLTYAKIFNASHMVPYDQPHISHDMILRFMGVNFSTILEGSARLPSAIGGNAKPLFIESAAPVATGVPVSGKTPEQDKAMWEAYYNAGSAALVLVLIFLFIGTFLWCRVRKRPLRLPISRTENEEGIPLNSSMGRDDDDDRTALGDDDRFRLRKGKERAIGQQAEGPPIFEVGDSDEEDGDGYKDGREK